LKSIAVYGHTPSAWVSAAFLRQVMGVDVTLIIPPMPTNMLDIKFAESFSPHVLRLMSSLGLQQMHWIKSCETQAHLGTRLCNIHNTHEHLQDVLLPHCEIAPAINSVEFHHYLSAFNDHDYEKYSLACQLMRANKFVPPSEDNNSIFSSYESSLSVEVISFTKLMVGFAQNLGIRLVNVDEGEVNSEAITCIDNKITHITTKSGVINADLFIDTSAQQVLQQVLAEYDEPEYDEQGNEDNLPSSLFNASIVFSTNNKLDNAFYDTVAIYQHGLLATHRLKQSLCYRYYFNDKQQDPQQAFNDISKALNIPENTAFRTEHYGQHQGLSWIGNVVALGDAKSRLNILGRGVLSDTIESLHRLIELMPSGQTLALNRQEYNRISLAQDTQHFCFLEAYLSLNQLPNTPFYSVLGNTLHDDLMHRLSLFKASGRDAHFEDDPLEKYQWRNIMIALGMQIDNIHPLVDVSDKKRQGQMQRIAELIRNTSYH
jgi:tryptophan halogenase